MTWPPKRRPGGFGGEGNAGKPADAVPESPVSVIWWGSLASFVAGSATGLGALGIFLVRRMNGALEDALLSSAAGIMLAASVFSLILPGIEAAERVYGSGWLAPTIVGGGMALGALGLWLIHRYAPHEHFVAGREGPTATKLARIWLFVIAITLHNFPEGIAVGVGFAGGNWDNGIALAIGIGLQNIPEGLAVSASLLAIDYSRARAFAVGALTGLVEPVGGTIGSLAVWFAEPAMPWLLAMAAGAMLFIISDEIIPETHRGPHKTLATFTLLAGFIAMMLLDVAIG